jgi:tetratricopeptide (TPR) repeat protein
MQRRGFFLVLALTGSAYAQGHPAENTRPPTPVVDIDSVPIGRSSANDAQRNQVSDSTFVSVSDLAVPERARKEVEKANQSMAKNNWSQARDRLNKAISFYPSYANAYNNLAVAYSHLGDVVRERQSLEKAIALDDHYGLARLNLGRMDIEQGKFSEAEMALNKAAILAPEDPGALVLLSYCQFLQKHFDDVIATMYQAHKLSAPHAFVHRAAARAFEQKRQFDRAATELNLFLQEQPVGPAAEAARKELEVVRATQRN